MKVCHTLICFFFLSLQGHNGLISAQLIVYTGTVGGDVTVECPSSFSYNRKVFCKENCKPEDILIDTTNVTAQSGRYRIQWTKGRTSLGDVSVTITQLTKSDSGRYWCGLGVTGSTSNQIEIVIVDAQLDTSSEVKTLKTQIGGNITVQCSFTAAGSRRYFCKDGCNLEDVLVETTGGTAQRDRYSIRFLTLVSGRGAFLHVSIRQLTQSDSGRYRCGLDSTLSQQLEIIVTDDSGDSTASSTQTTTRDVLLAVCVTLVFLVILSVSVLIFRRKRSSKPKDSPEQDEFVTESNQVYENISTDRKSRSPPVAEDDLSRLTYSEMDFSNWAVGSSGRARHGYNDNVVYSVPRVAGASDASRAEDNSPVYSTVT